LSTGAAILASLGASAAALFSIGALTSLFTGRSVVFSGARQLCIGLGAAAVTFLLGRLLGVSIA
jgi:VIT1/CCC1 family predicted Fe2+/Mn2+ transporter